MVLVSIGWSLWVDKILLATVLPISGGKGFVTTVWMFFAAVKYPARLRKNAVRASFPFFGLSLSDSQRASVWRFTPI